MNEVSRKEQNSLVDWHNGAMGHFHQCSGKAMAARLVLDNPGLSWRNKACSRRKCQDCRAGMKGSDAISGHHAPMREYSDHRQGLSFNQSLTWQVP